VNASTTNGTGAPPASAPETDADAFKTKVAESQATIQNTLIQPKRGRGKRGPDKQPRQRLGAEGSSAPASTASNPSQPPQSAPDIAPYLVAPIMTLSKIPAHRLGVAELAFDQNEAGACAYSLNQVLTAFAPAGQMNPKSAAIFGCVVTFASIGFSKMQIYQTAMEKRNLENPRPQAPEPQAVEPGTHPEKTPGSVLASDHFKK